MKIKLGTGGTAQWLKALDFLAEDLSFIPSTYIVATTF